jgi:hypothetical protein
LCPAFLSDARFWMLLFRLDEDLAREAREGGCPSCCESLHSACYRRKSRGGPGHAASREQGVRFSFCCSNDRCRRRMTPPSVRFVGRRVFLSAIVVLVTTLRQGPSTTGLRKLERLFGINRRTIARWQKWWKEVFPSSGVWKELKGRLSRSRVLPPFARSLLDRLKGHPSSRLLLRLLRSLSVLATGSRPRPVPGGGECR